VTTISNATTAIVLLLVLPFFSRLLTRKYGFGVIKRDLLLTHVSIAVVIVGSLIAAFAAVPWLFISSTVIFSLGFGVTALSRAVLTAVVEPHAVAALNTTLATVETLAIFVSSPCVAWLLGKGMELGGVWMGLHFQANVACGVLSLIAIWCFRIPSGMA
jgi:hypothetical protein